LNFILSTSLPSRGSGCPVGHGHEKEEKHIFENNGPDFFQKKNRDFLFLSWDFYSFFVSYQVEGNKRASRLMITAYIFHSGSINHKRQFNQRKMGANRVVY